MLGEELIWFKLGNQEREPWPLFRTSGSYSLEKAGPAKICRNLQRFLFLTLTG